MKKQILNIIPALSSLLFVVSCTGQVITDSNYNVSQQGTINGENPKIVRTQGISSGNINCELLDRDGNLWFSINGEGIYRFDNKSFENFTTVFGMNHFQMELHAVDLAHFIGHAGIGTCL